MNLEQEALTFIQKLASHYFEHRDMNAVSSHLEERTSWIGTGKDELIRNMSEASQALALETEEYGGVFRITQLQCETAAIHGVGCIAYGTVTAEPENPEFSAENVRFTAVTEHTQEGVRLLHLHFSHPDYLQEQGRYYVPRSAAVDNQSLRSTLAIRDHQLTNLTKYIPGGAHQCANNPNLTLLSMSDGFLSQFGYTQEEIETLFQNQFINMIYPSDRADVLRTVAEQIEIGPYIELEYRVMHKNGQSVWVLDKGRLMEDGAGGQCFYCLLVEINDRKREQEELRLTLERHQVIMDQATDIIFEWDICADTLLFSQNWRKKFGYKAIGQKISDRIPLSKNIHPDDVPAFVKIMKDTATGVPYSEVEFRIRNTEGAYLWCRIRATTQYDENKRPIKAVGVIVDIDREKRQQQALLDQAQRDALTGLYNKATVNALVEQRMQGKMPDEIQALLIIDIDYFKRVNDTYGHLCGDSLLSDVAAALKLHTRSTDVAGRIGGDEFLIYLPEVASEAAVRKKVEILLSSLQLLTPEIGAPPISCSIGVAIFPRGSIDYYALYKCADQALYHQKSNGRGGFSIYQPSLGGMPPCGMAPTAVGSEIGSDGSNVVGEQMAQYAFRTLYTSKHVESALNRLLEIIGRSFDVSRAYIFESSEDGTRCSNTFEWCGEGVASQIDILQNIAYVDDLGDYLKNFDEHGIFYCHDIESLHPDVYAVLKPQGIRSVLQCAVLDEGEFVGYVGFDECRENRAWNPRQVASFKLTADVLSTFLIKLREKQKRRKQNENL